MTKKPTLEDLVKEAYERGLIIKKEHPYADAPDLDIMKLLLKAMREINRLKVRIEKLENK